MEVSAGTINNTSDKKPKHGRIGRPGEPPLSIPTPRRWMALLRFCATILVLQFIREHSSLPEILLIAALGVYSLLTLLPDRKGSILAPLGSVTITLDLLLACLVLHVTGGINSPLVPVLYLPLIEAGITLSLGWSLGIVAAGVGSLAFVCYWSSPGHFSQSHLFQPLTNFTAAALLIVLSVNTARLFAHRSEERARKMELDMVRLQGEKQRLNQLAEHDGLTGLPNRACFHEQLAQMLAQCFQNKRQLALLIVDLDDFHHLNEAWGHEDGDRLLQLVAQRLAESVRKGDLLARLGSDEFAIAIPYISDVQTGVTSGRHIQTELSAQPFALKRGDHLATACVGVSFFPTDGYEPGSLIKSAEAALRRAKDHGSSNLQLHKPTTTANPVERITLQRDLRRAIEQDELILFFQPQVNLEKRKLYGVEALIRWHHPTMGLLSPGKFIGLAEETGLIIPLTEWVLRNACKQNKAWQMAGFPPFHVAVNLSARQFQHKTVIPTVEQVLKETGLDPHWLELEVTESVAMQEPDYTISVLRTLKEMGIEISMDDFGTGFSSLSYLKTFPFDTIKIDQSFVRDIGKDSGSADIVATIINLSKSLGRKVIAEGVENETQVLFLRKHGCQQIQGYLISKPVRADELTKLLQRRRYPGVQKYSRFADGEEDIFETIARYSYAMPPAQLV